MSLRHLVTAFAILFLGAAAAAPAPSLKPPAPVSPYIAQDQAQRLRAVFENLDDRQYEAARAARIGITDPLARTIATWAILHSNDETTTIEEIDVFLDAHPGWPNPLTLQRKAERMLDDETPTSTIFTFFDTRDPITGFGKVHLARALLDLRREDLARDYIRKAWIEHNFNTSDSQQILERYGRYLTEEDHFAKADRALFRRSTGGVEDVRGLLSETRAKEVQARYELIRGRRHGVILFEALPPQSQRDSGVLHAIVRYLRRADLEEEAIELAGLAPLNPEKLRDPDGWFYERKLLARWALKEGRFADAYNLSAYSGLEQGADFAEAEFMAGWTALRFLNDPARARAHFDFLTSGVTSPISLARGNYWLGRAYSAMGDEVRARAHYLVAADYPYTFYGQMAIETLGSAAPVFAFPEAVPVTDADRKALDDRDLARAMRILDHIDQNLTFRRFALALDDQLENEGEVRAYAELVRQAHEFDLIVRAGKTSRRNGAGVAEVVYPLVPVPQTATAFVEEPLILGLSRQESEFKVDAYSSARAKGMMQLLDSTARITARKEGIPWERDRLLTDPVYNMTLGAAHLSHLLDRFGGSYVMVLAAYNAGPHRVDDWVETYGDPRDPSVDPIDWVELIPFSETRNYVMRVLENTQVYRSRITDLPLGLQLTEDLTRGSASSFASIGQPVPAPNLWLAADVSGPPIITQPQLDRHPMALVRAEGLIPPVPTVPPATAANR
ncbi:lytic transglycosylase domain-containing protein [Parvularcula lutaonensis]|uniref:Transglycosylase SLT domain-containing protein n=1 Tax=Parvularcula lutaonensis TaxID=491923 RepID=A0ABV7MCQ6_9PROT|nr:lytic transglycosylase domain-containing protein [Parvularcula lutaonensis]GGY51439.1 lytic transglycosylase [Parvularcula lutaonensis]